MIDNQEVLRDSLPKITPKSSQLLTEVLVGLSKRQKSVPPKFLYDERGSEIFEMICELPEYYPTRTETKILKDYGQEMASLIGPEALIIEPGSGSGEKVRYLLRHLKRPAGLVPIEISREILYRMTGELHEEFPRLKVTPVWGDFTENIDLPLSVESVRGKKVVFFPGSTLGNFNPPDAVEFLKQYGRLVGSGGGFLIGVDTKKEGDRLIRAYDDAAGVTAAFNLNLLERLNREVAATFDVDNFFHKAIFNADLGRVEMHLVSKVSQLVRVHQTVFRFQEGESIHTESSYKYSVEEFGELAAKAKWAIKKTWLDKEGLFCVYYLERE